MESKESVAFVFRDPKWIIKSLVSLIPIVNLGMYKELILNVALDRDELLPPIDDIGGLFKTGLNAFVVLIVFSLVVMLPIMTLFGGLIAIAVVAGVLGTQGNTEASIAVIVLTYIAFFMVYIALIVFMQIVTPVIWLRICLTDSIGKVLVTGEILRFIKRNLKDLFMIIVYMFILVLGVWLLGVVTLGFGIFVAAPLMQFAMFHLYGQLLRKSGGFDDLGLDSVAY